MLDPLQGRDTATVPLMIHNTGVECNESVAIRVGPQSYTTVERRFGHLYTRFHCIQRAAIVTQHFPGAFVRSQAGIPG